MMLPKREFHELKLHKNANSLRKCRLVAVFDKQKQK